MADGMDAGQARPGARRALVVAVDPDRRELLSRELHSAGLEPELATDGKHAERIAAASLPDALVLDQGMPGLALFRLYSSLRGLPGGTDVPIFFVGQTGTDTPTDHYLPAELSLREVADRVRDEVGLATTAQLATSEPAVEEPPVMHVGPAAPVTPITPDAAGTTSLGQTGPANAASWPSDVTFEPAGADTRHLPAEHATAVPPESFAHPSETVHPTEPHRVEAAPDLGAPVVAATSVTPEAPPADAERATPTVEPPIAADTHAADVHAVPAAPTTEPVVPPVEPAPRPVPPPIIVPGPPSGAPADPTPVVAADPAPVAEDRAPVPAGGVSRISRLDVVLLRLGLVLLLLGGAVLLLRPDSSTQPIAPPSLATATPATKPTPPPSPSPAAVAPGR